MLLIDVRTPEEFSREHAEGAINLPLDEIQNGILPDVNKDEVIKLYCRSGGRASVAENILRKNGFINLDNLGGLTDVLNKKTNLS